METLITNINYGHRTNFDVEYIYGFVWRGGLHAKSMTSQR